MKPLVVFGQEGALINLELLLIITLGLSPQSFDLDTIGQTRST